LAELLVFVMQPGTLHFVSGRLAAGETTLRESLPPSIMPFSFVKTFGSQNCPTVSRRLMTI
jgi:hypothetical protein